MGVMDIKSVKLSAQLTLLAELSGKPKLDEKVKTYYESRLRHCTEEELERAFSVFGDRGVWPTVEQILIECGHRAMPSRQEQAASLERDRALPRRDETTPEEMPYWETQYGEWVFRAIGPQQIRDVERALDDHGWTILDHRTLELTTETKVGKVLRRDPVTAIDFLAIRWKTPPPTKEIPPYIRGRTAMQIIEKLKERMALK